VDFVSKTLANANTNPQLKLAFVDLATRFAGQGPRAPGGRGGSDGDGRVPPQSRRGQGQRSRGGAQPARPSLRC